MSLLIRQTLHWLQDVPAEWAGRMCRQNGQAGCADNAAMQVTMYTLPNLTRGTCPASPPVMTRKLLNLCGLDLHLGHVKVKLAVSKMVVSRVGLMFIDMSSVQMWEELYVTRHKVADHSV